MCYYLTIVFRLQFSLNMLQEWMHKIIFSRCNRIIMREKTEITKNDYTRRCIVIWKMNYYHTIFNKKHIRVSELNKKTTTTTLLWFHTVRQNCTRMTCVLTVTVIIPNDICIKTVFSVWVQVVKAKP